MNRKKEQKREKGQVRAQAQRPFLRRVQNCFVGDTGLRQIWKIGIAAAAYACAMLFLPMLIARAFAALIAAWGVTGENFAYAPRWTQVLIRSSDSVSVILTSSVVLLTAWLLRKCWRIPQVRRRIRTREFLRGFGLAALIVLIGLGGFLLLDSVRPGRRFSTPIWQIEQGFMGAAVFLFALAGAYMLRGTVYALGKGYRINLPGAIASLGLQLWSYGQVGVRVSWVMALSGIAMAILFMSWYERSENCGREAGFYCAWTLLLGVILGFPDGAVSGALYEIYPVSENWLTGGASGLAGGAYGAVVLWGLCLVAQRKRLFARHRRE